MSQWNGTIEGSVVPAQPRRGTSRRRGSVMILVIALLSILFVLGVAFLATMNFEAEMIAAEQGRLNTEAGTEGVAGATDQLLHDRVLPDSSATLPSAIIGESMAGIVDLPAYHSLAAPIEPYLAMNPGGVNPPAAMAYRWYTDTEWLLTGKHARDSYDPTTYPHACAPRHKDLLSGNTYVGSYRECEIITTGTTFSGDPAISGDPGNGVLPYDRFEGDYVAAVDVDGDGIRDSFQVNVKQLGFSEEQRRALSAAVNDPGQKRDDAFLGLRIVPHGGMVNLNEAHPRLIESVFELGFGKWPQPGDPPDSEIDFFVHAPTQVRTIGRDIVQNFYQPAFDEPALRRRGFLPPRTASPSRLHGNPFEPNSVLAKPNMLRLYPPNNQPPDIRYWPAGYDEERDDSVRLFDVRMDWEFAAYYGNTLEYDRRHLVTTTSHDDLLSRGARAFVGVDAAGNPDVRDMNEAMQQVNGRAISDALAATNNCPTQLPFEYPLYPRTILDNVDNQTCLCQGDPRCKTDPVRKGRLQLSLAWLDEALNDGHMTFEQIQRLIYDAFAMMISNAVGDYWTNRAATRFCIPQAAVTPCVSGEYCRADIPDTLMRGFCTSTARYWEDPPWCLTDTDCGPGPYVCRKPPAHTQMVCVDAQAIDPGTGLPMRRGPMLISRAAAELTANLLDYVDADDVPTRVALRSYDFTAVFDLNATTSAGQELRDPNGNTLYVHGVERQPYITEIASFMPGAPVPTAYAVELFNPYDTDIKAPLAANKDYYLYVSGPGDKDPQANGLQIPIGQDLKAGAFTVFYSGLLSDVLGGGARNGVDYHDTAGKLAFVNGGTIYLVRRVDYGTIAAPDVNNIVVDQFAIQGARIGQPALALTPPVMYPVHAALERSLAQTKPWTCTVPVVNEFDPTAQSYVSLGAFSAPVTLSFSANLHPVEVNPANTGRFAWFAPPSNNVPVAFPTTGSMLLLTRHANHAFRAPNLAVGGVLQPAFVPQLAFTQRLIDTTTWSERQPTGPMTFGGVGVTVNAKDEIDNGRMPVFDRGANISFYDLYAGSPIQRKRGAHHVSPDHVPQGEPGKVSSLPWGQLVFDYFTALPLASWGPYRVFDWDSVALEQWQAAQPRVDMNGLRVHGRIDINAAPWRVLRGLPLMPISRLPQPYGLRILAALSTPLQVTDDVNAFILQDQPARAIEAYREAREIADLYGLGYGSTGNYGNDTPGVTPRDGWRGYDRPYADARRGTGFATVGELANVRHTLAWSPAPPSTQGSPFRMDLGYVNANNADGADYLNAIAVLVALGDWVTVKSHVYTVYGTVRGAPRALFDDPSTDEGDLAAPGSAERRQQLDDIDARAIRFQETVDRLPMLLKEPKPTRIGGRTLSAYTDFSTD